MSSAFSSSDRMGDARGVHTKIFQRRAVLNLDHSTTIPANTLDISSAGVSVIIDRPLPEGLKLTIDISVILDDEAAQARFTCQVRSNVLAGMKGFRIGLEFTNLDAAASSLLKQMMGAS
jgi:c-di-GMP-binding flagellar brake protein YcgR